MRTLLTKGESSAKLAKDAGKGYRTAILYLASGQFDARLCPAAGACKVAEFGLCLVLNSGRTAMSIGKSKGPEAAKIARTHLYFDNPKLFRAQLEVELMHLEREAAGEGLKAAARLNGGSDLDWIDLYKKFPNIQFWEYTKRADLAVKLSKLSNLSVTFSYSETTTARVLAKMVAAKINIAVVFDTPRGSPLPATFKGLQVIDGDTSDLRFRDKSGVAIGLRFKSAKARKAKAAIGVASGFVQSERSLA